MKKGIIISLVAVALIVLTVMKLKSNQHEIQSKIYINDPNAEILVNTSQPEMHTFQGSFSYLGTFLPFRQSTVGADAAGTIVKVNFDEGDFVKAGQMLAKVDDELLQLQLKNAEIGLEGASNDNNRFSSLVKENAVSGSQAEKINMNYRSSEVQKKLILKQIKNTAISAPFSGVITRKMFDLGSFVGQGTPIYEIVDISSLKLTVFVPERDVLKFKLNETVSISVDLYGDKPFKGKIMQIASVADQSHNFKVQVLVSNASKELKAGMYGSVKMGNSESTTGLSIPRLALVGSSKKTQVYVVKGDRVKLVSFSPGASDGDFIEVLSGISKDDEIVVKGQVNLQDNAKIKIKK
jgi:RND family efflux transporter MFP subunit